MYSRLDRWGFVTRSGRRSLVQKIDLPVLRALLTHLYHAGFRGKISRSTFADANEKRDWRIYSDLKSLYGTSPNAVRTQVWIAISVYVLVAILKKELKLERTLSENSQILIITLFEKRPIFTVLTAAGEQMLRNQERNSLPLFEF